MQGPGLEPLSSEPKRPILPLSYSGLLTDELNTYLLLLQIVITTSILVYVVTMTTPQPFIFFYFIGDVSVSPFGVFLYCFDIKWKYSFIWWQNTFVHLRLEK